MNNVEGLFLLTWITFLAMARATRIDWNRRLGRLSVVRSPIRQMLGVNVFLQFKMEASFCVIDDQKCYTGVQS